MEQKFEVVAADFTLHDGGEASITFRLNRGSVEAWRHLVDPLPDDGDLKRCIELLLERAREAS